MTEQKIDTAMVLAAGFGKRLRPITDKIPKPLVEVGGRTMLDRALDTLVESKISRAVINVHYLGEQITAHCETRDDINCIISDESDAILETGGGTVRALPLLGDRPFALLNADTFWIDHGAPTLQRMIDAFDESKMDILLLLCRADDATGHSGGHDFTMADDGKLARAKNSHDDGYIYAGAAIYNPSIFDPDRLEPHSLNIYFDQAIAQDRLSGIILEDGHWITVGTPQGLSDAEAKLRELG